MADDAAPLLRRARKEAGNVDEGDERKVEAVAEADEARGLHRGVDVQAAGEVRGLVGHQAHRPPVEPRRTRPVLIGALETSLTKSEPRPHRKHGNIPL